MNVCMVAYTFYESDNRVRRYAELLADRGDRVDAVALRRPGMPEYAVIRGVHVYRIQERVIDERGPLSYLVKLLLFFIRSSVLLARRHLRHPYHLIHVHSVPDFEVFAALIPKIAGAKIILDIHDIVPEFYASKFRVSERSFIFRLLLFVERCSIGFAHHVIIANHLWRETLVKRSVKDQKCTALINYPDLSIFYQRPPKSPNPGQFVLCYPGSLNWHQGLDIVVRAMSLVKGKAPGAQLLIIGDGPEKSRLQTLVWDLHLEGMVSFHDRVPIEEVAEFMASADLGVVPKRSDSFGNEAFSTKIMEFMAMGVPVLASETKVDRYYFNDRLVCFFRSSDVEDLASKIVELALFKAKRQELTTAARTFIVDNCWDVKKTQYWEVVDRILGGG